MTYYFFLINDSFLNALKTCYSGLIDIGKQLGIHQISLKGKEYTIESIFLRNPVPISPEPVDNQNQNQNQNNNPNDPHNNQRTNSNITLEELKGRRNLLIRAIDQKMKDSPTRNPILIDTKVSFSFFFFPLLFFFSNFQILIFHSSFFF